MLAQDGIEAEVIDLRWLRPLDLEPVFESIKKTNRAVIVEEIAAPLQRWGGGRGPGHGPGLRLHGRADQARQRDGCSAALCHQHRDDGPAGCAEGRRSGERGTVMAETIQMPKLGFDMAEGTLVNWLKQVGDSVGKGDVIAEIETDKATIEIEASVSGTVLKLLAEPGTVVPVGADIAVVGAAGRSRPRWRRSGARRPPPAPAPAEAAAPAASSRPRSRPRRPPPARADGNGHCPATSRPARWPAAWPKNAGSIWPRSRAAALVAGSSRRTWRASSPALRPAAAPDSGRPRPSRRGHARAIIWRAALRPGRRDPRHEQGARPHRPPHGRVQAAGAALLRHHGDGRPGHAGPAQAAQRQPAGRVAGSASTT